MNSFAHLLEAPSSAQGATVDSVGKIHGILENAGTDPDLV
jgi:hypothetical protein